MLRMPMRDAVVTKHNTDLWLRSAKNSGDHILQPILIIDIIDD